MRSRLEARHAVFFDALGIPWEYEKEGYEIEGIRYLPDFWLPEQDCFVEIKGQEPTDDEIDKARLLALYAQKRVAMFYGSIEFPPMENSTHVKSHHFLAPSVWKFKSSEGVVGGPSTTRMDVPLHILALMQKLYDHHLGIGVDFEGDVIIAHGHNLEPADNLDALIEYMSTQLSGLKQFKPTIERLKGEIRDALMLERGWSFDFLAQPELGLEDDCTWLECDHCGKIHLSFSPFDTHNCDDGIVGTFLCDTPRLLAAYTAARSARFEFGEKGR
jgi:hypothetical protein